MKNWQPFVPGPRFAIDTMPRLSCCIDNDKHTSGKNPHQHMTPPSTFAVVALPLTLRLGWNSSSISPPQMHSPPFPVPVGSPACTMNSRMFLNIIRQTADTIWVNNDS